MLPRFFLRAYADTVILNRGSSVEFTAGNVSADGANLYNLRRNFRILVNKPIKMEKFPFRVFTVNLLTQLSLFSLAA